MITNPGEISLEDSLKICQESIKKAREEEFMPITVTVVDVAGVIRATLAENGSASIRADIAYAKAWSCIQAGMSTTLLRDVIEEQPRLTNAFRGMQIIANGKLIPTPGGLLIQKDGKNIGAIGVSGDRSDEDDICAIAAIEAVGLTVGHKAI
ncbi:heme-binding protein [Gammaproteobacteria bacterium]|nr:heme-binding protein [Gammaproteobacteria bacterium]|tara:strand:+ start:299 stop:754 length:456 start_codon:yes stop_codon:yes gene_type:complete